MAPRSRASTPHRLTRSSMIHPSPGLHHPISTKSTPLDEFKSNFLEMNDSLGDLDKNLQDIQRIHEDLTSFNESFASFLYGLQVNAYIVEFDEVPEDLKSVNEGVEINKKIARLQEELDGGYQRNPAVLSDAHVHEDEAMLTNDADGSFMIQPKSKISQPQATKRQSIRTKPVQKPQTTRSSAHTNRHVTQQRAQTHQPTREITGTTGTTRTTTTRAGTTGTTGTTGTIRKDSRIPVGKRKTDIDQRPPFR